MQIWVHHLAPHEAATVGDEDEGWHLRDCLLEQVTTLSPLP